MLQALSCQAAEHEAAVARLQNERRESARALRAANEELAGMLADQLVAAMPTSELRSHAALAICPACNSVQGAVINLYDWTLQCETEGLPSFL